MGSIVPPSSEMGSRSRHHQHSSCSEQGEFSGHIEQTLGPTLCLGNDEAVAVLAWKQWPKVSWGIEGSQQGQRCWQNGIRWWCRSSCVDCLAQEWGQRWITASSRGVRDVQFFPWFDLSHDGNFHVSDTSRSESRHASRAKSPSLIFCGVVHWVLCHASFHSVPLVLTKSNVDNLDDHGEKEAVIWILWRRLVVCSSANCGSKLSKTSSWFCEETIISDQNVPQFNFS